MSKWGDRIRRGDFRLRKCTLCGVRYPPHFIMGDGACNGCHRQMRVATDAR